MALVRLKRLKEYRFASIIRYLFKKDFLIGRKCKAIIKGNILRKDKNSRLYLNVIDDSCPFLDKGYLFIDSKAKIFLEGENLILSGCRIVCYKESTLELNGCFVNFLSQVYCKEKITIGEGTFIGPECVIADTDYHSISNKVVSCPIEIGKKVWVGRRVQILKGVKIGDGSVIAAGSIVTKDIPANVLVAGSPARIIRENISWKK